MNLYCLLNCTYVLHYFFQPNLFPTVGLQTPGEVVDANFGQMPFLFNIQEMMKELRSQTQMTIQNYPFSYPYSQCQTNFHK